MLGRDCEQQDRPITRALEDRPKQQPVPIDILGDRVIHAAGQNQPAEGIPFVRQKFAVDVNRGAGLEFLSVHPREHSHILQHAVGRAVIVALTEYPVEPPTAEPGDQPPRLLLARAAERRSRQAEERSPGCPVAPSRSDAKPFQNPCELGRSSNVRLVDNHARRLGKPLVLIRTDPISELVDGGHDDLASVDRFRYLVGAPEAADPELFHGAISPPDLAPGLDGLLAELVGGRDPHDRTP